MVNKRSVKIMDNLKHIESKFQDQASGNNC